MSEICELHRLALDDFGRRVHRIEGAGWRAETPWRGSTVREVVNHVVAEHLRVPPLLAGATDEEVEARFDGDLLGELPARVFDDAGRAAYVAFATVPSLERTVMLATGPTPAEEYLWQLIADLAVHSWDVARGLGTRCALDPLVAVAVHDRYQEWRYRDRRSGLATPAMLDELIDVPPDADPATRLMALFGRDPN